MAQVLAEARAARIETKTTNESGLDQAIPEGKVLDFVQAAAEARKKQATVIAEVEPTDEETAPETVAKIKKVTEDTTNRIDRAQDEAASRIQEAMGIVLTAEAPAGPETVQALPVSAVGEEPTTELFETKEKTEAEQLKEAADEMIKINADVLADFYEKHGENPKWDVERMYVQVLLAKHAEGLALLAYANAMLSGQPETEIKRLDEEVDVKETASRLLEKTYLNMDEMKEVTEADASKESETRAEEEPLTFEKSVGKLRQLFDKYVANSNAADLRKEVRKFASEVHPDRQKDPRVSELSVLANQLMDAFKDPSQMEGENLKQFLAALAVLEASLLGSSAVVKNIINSKATNTGGSIESLGFGGEPPVAALSSGTGGTGEPRGRKGVSTSKDIPGAYVGNNIADIKNFKGPDAGPEVKKGFFGKIVSWIVRTPGSKDRH